MANATFAVQAAQATHRAAEAALLVGGLSSIVLIGIDLYSAEGCAAVLQYGLKSIVSLGVGAAANCVASVGCDVLAAKFGVNPDYLRIAADSVQLVCLIIAARSRNQMIGCFVGNTMVDTINHGFEPISAVYLGERVDTQPNDSSAGAAPLSLGGATMVNPATWRVVDLTTADPNVPGDSYQMQLLEPLSWIAQEGASAGKWIDVSIPELQISGRVQVVSIGACPSIESGGGQVVLGTFEHVSTDVVNVNLMGQSQPLQVTSGHKLWSLDRGGWVKAGNLLAGERLEGQSGPVVVDSVTSDPTATAVYNLDVETDHRYLVTSLGVLAHNADQWCTPGPQPIRWSSYKNEFGRMVRFPVFSNFADAMRASLSWIRQQTGKLFEGKSFEKSPFTGDVYGVNSDSRTGYRIEYDDRANAHINVFAGKGNRLHIGFEGTEADVKVILRQLFPF